jgi:hypothetical protein
MANHGMAKKMNRHCEVNNPACKTEAAAGPRVSNPQQATPLFRQPLNSQSQHFHSTGEESTPIKQEFFK